MQVRVSVLATGAAGASERNDGGGDVEGSPDVGLFARTHTHTSVVMYATLGAVPEIFKGRRSVLKSSSDGHGSRDQGRTMTALSTPDGA